MGNNFTVDCKAGFEQEKIQTIDDTVDYAVLADLIKNHFAVPTALLETLAARIEEDVKVKFPALKYFYISIKKMNPALSVQTESSEVIIENNY